MRRKVEDDFASKAALAKALANVQQQAEERELGAMHRAEEAKHAEKTIVNVIDKRCNEVITSKLE